MAVIKIVLFSSQFQVPTSFILHQFFRRIFRVCTYLAFSTSPLPYHTLAKLTKAAALYESAFRANSAYLSASSASPEFIKAGVYHFKETIGISYEQNFFDTFNLFKINLAIDKEMIGL